MEFCSFVNPNCASELVHWVNVEEVPSSAHRLSKMSLTFSSQRVINGRFDCWSVAIFSSPPGGHGCQWSKNIERAFFSFFLPKINEPLASTKREVNRIYRTVRVFFLLFLLLPMLLRTFTRAASQTSRCNRLPAAGSSFRYGLRQPADALCRWRPRCLFNFLRWRRRLRCCGSTPPNLPLPRLTRSSSQTDQNIKQPFLWPF